MRYSISNIAWGSQDDVAMYEFLHSQGIEGLEIAPTRLFENPYKNLEISWQYAQMLKNRYNLTVSSMQSIWYGVEQNIFGSDKDRQFLIDYTKSAIDFAQSMDIKNMVFGCPKNRNMPSGSSEDEVIDFFREISDYAFKQNTCISLEANPVIYNTNFLNTTRQACEFCKRVASEGCKVNIDFGTILYNEENPHIIKTYKTLVNHIHLSVPNLEYVEKTSQHATLKKVLDKIDYNGFLSVEMKNQNDIEKVKNTVRYLKEAF